MARTKTDQLEEKILWWEDFLAKEEARLQRLREEKLVPLQKQYRKELGIDD